MAAKSVRHGPRRPTITYIVTGLIVRPIVRWIFRQRVYGTERLPVGQGFVLASNHISIVDPFPLALPFFPRQLRFMAKIELFRPVLRSIFTALGAFPVHRGRGDVAAVKTATRLVEEGEIVLIFPEGTSLGKTHWMELRDRLHRGAAISALEAGAPLVPIAIKGSDRLSRLGPIRILCGEPLELDDVRELPRREATLIATQRLRSALGELIAELEERESGSRRDGAG